MRSYATDAGTVFIANMLGALAALGVQASLAWLLMPAGRGQYAAGLVFATVLVLTFALGQEMANVFHVGSGALTPSQATSQSLAVGVVVSACACAVGYALTRTSLPFLNKAPVQVFHAALLCVPAALFHMYLSHILLGLSAITAYTVITVGPFVLLLLGLLAGACLGLNVATALMLQAASNAILAAAALLWLRRRHDARLVPLDAAALRRSLHYGARFCLGKLCSLANGQIGTIVLLFSTRDAAQVGLFAAGAALASRLWLLAEALQTAWLPRSAGDPEGESRRVAKTVRLCLVCCAAAAVVLFALSKPIIIVVLSPAFLPILVPFWVLLPGVVVRSVSKILPAYFNGMDRPQVTSLAMGGTLLTNVVLMSWFLPKWGLVGVALAMSVSYAVEALFMALAFSRLSRLPVSTLCRVSRDDWRDLRGLAGGALRRYRRRTAHVER